MTSELNQGVGNCHRDDVGRAFKAEEKSCSEFGRRETIL